MGICTKWSTKIGIQFKLKDLLQNICIENIDKIINILTSYNLQIINFEFY